MIINLTDDNFEKEVLESAVPVLVDFWAGWCMPCKMIAPVIEEVAREYEGKIKVCKLNIDEASMIPSKYGIMSIPTLIIFKNGEEKGRTVGTVSKENIITKIGEYI